MDKKNQPNKEIKRKREREKNEDMTIKRARERTYNPWDVCKEPGRNSFLKS